MAELSRVDALAREELEADVDKTIAKLENGAGQQAGCPGHTHLAHGVVLCLKLLRRQIREVRSSPKNHLAASGAASFVAVLVVEILKNLVEK